ncbi:MAG: GxxExxY protein [Bacteroidia bacterium]|nr:GxxExxY protein [Bacteroidia bacterium]
MTSDLLYKDLSYKVIGLCMEVHTILGRGLSEVVYKDALEYEFKKAEIFFSREKQYKVQYKDIVLDHYYCADFVIDDYIVLEIKAISSIADNHVKQTLNYLAISGLRLGLLVNFGEDRLSHRRVIL